MAVLFFFAAPGIRPAHAQPQVPLTVGYTIVGASGTQVQDYLTYVSEGTQQVVLITGTPTYMVDSGSQWSVLGVLDGSNSSVRWAATGDLGGTIQSATTISYTYYEQFMVSFNYNVTNGGEGYSGPSVGFNQFGAPASEVAPALTWVDASSPYTYASQLPGSSSTERWTPNSGESGAVKAAGAVIVTYYHQYLVTSSYSVIGGGSPTAPTLSSTAFGQADAITMTLKTQPTWLDAGVPYGFTANLTLPAGLPSKEYTGETWIGTVTLQTPTGSVLATTHNGTVTGPISLTPAYHHEFLVDLDFHFVGGTPTGVTLPAFAYQFLGSKASADSNTTVWVDSGSSYSLPGSICCVSSPSTDRWELDNTTAGTITFSTTIESTYFHQYFDSFFYSFVGQPPPSQFPEPVLTYVGGGATQQVTLLQSAQAFWVDSNTTYATTASLTASGGTERWFAPLATGSDAGPGSNQTIDIAYHQQYLLTLQGGGLTSEWVDAGNNSTLTAPGVYGRSQGTGYRIVSYQIAGEPVVSVTQPTLTLSIQVSMNGPQTISFQSVPQFQVTLDNGATQALNSITPPTIPGDSYWYDSGSGVQVVLAGEWGRAHGVGERITSISATAQATIQVDTVGAVQAFSTSSLDLPISITTTSVTQYEVVLNPAASSAFVSITPPSTFPGDTFWFDSGASAPTVVLNGVYSRSAGTGMRTTSWSLDGGPPNSVATAGELTIVTKAMTSPQFINATFVIQYQVTVDKGGTAALSSITNPPIAGDKGWYDSTSPIGIVMNGVWGRASGTGQRLVGYSINGGPEVTVDSSGLVTVLNLPNLLSPEAITTSVVTQYQVTLDSGATTALFSITPSPVPSDKYWYDAGTAVAVSLDGEWGRTASSGTRLASYSINGGTPKTVLSSTQVQVLSLAGISSPESITTKTTTQYHLSSSLPWESITNSTLPGDAAGWFDSGTAVKVVYGDFSGPTTGGSRVAVTGYSIDGGSSTTIQQSTSGTFTVSVTMGAAHAITLAHVTQYLATIVGPPKATANPPSPTGDSYFDSGSKVTFAVPRIWNGSEAGVREELTSYSVGGGPPVNVSSSSVSTTFTTAEVTFDSPQTLVFNALPQYEVAFSYYNANGGSVVVPSLVELALGNSTLDLKGPSTWLANGSSFRIVNVLWEGVDVGPTPPPSYEVKAAPLNVTLDTKVYAASIKVVDLFGLPVSGAKVSMLLTNGTTVSGTTKADGVYTAGLVPLGTFTAKVSSLGTTAKISGDVATGQPLVEGKVVLSLFSLLVAVAVVAGASGGAILAVRQVKLMRASRARSAPPSGK